MCIMAVDAEKEALNDLREKLCAQFPKETIVTFTNPIEALTFADNNKIDLLFTDVRLRPIDGYELIEALRKEQTFFAYVVSGARERPDDFSWMNVNGCYAKPITSEELSAIRTEIAG